MATTTSNNNILGPTGKRTVKHMGFQKLACTSAQLPLQFHHISFKEMFTYTRRLNYPKSKYMQVTRFTTDNAIRGSLGAAHSS
jgi:hypothetical protein